MKHDIVYLLKTDIDSDELKYSIRSVVQNFPYRKIVFVGGKPDDIDPDIYLPDEQPGNTKWQKSTHSLRLACKCDDLTDDIWLFNDDFFVLKKQEGPFVNMVNGSIERYVNDIIIRNQELAIKSAVIRATLSPRISHHKQAIRAFIRKHCGKGMTCNSL